MRSATGKVLALCAILACGGAAAAEDRTPGPGGFASHAVPTTTGAADEAPRIDAAPSDDAATAYQTLSTLGALTLGVIGLLWVRRHIAEL